MGCSNGCQSPFLDINLHHIGIHLSALSGAAVPSEHSLLALSPGSPHRGLHVPFPPLRSHERSSEPNTPPRANTKSCLSALPFCVGVHLVTEPLDAFPVFLGDTWVSGLILHKKKKKKKKTDRKKKQTASVREACK